MALSSSHYIFRGIIKYCSILFFLLHSNTAFSQRAKADSLSKLLLTEKKDSNRVKLMWQLADVVNIYNPDTALILSQRALYLAKEIKYIEGQSRSMGVLANTFVKMGN